MSAPWRAQRFLAGLLVLCQCLVNRCQQPKKALPSLPAVGILSGIPAAQLCWPAGMTHRSGMRGTAGVAHCCCLDICLAFPREEAGISGSKSNNLLIDQEGRKK